MNVTDQSVMLSCYASGEILSGPQDERPTMVARRVALVSDLKAKVSDPKRGTKCGEGKNHKLFLLLLCRHDDTIRYVGE